MTERKTPQYEYGNLIEQEYLREIEQINEYENFYEVEDEDIIEHFVFESFQNIIDMITDVLTNTNKSVQIYNASIYYVYEDGSERDVINEFQVCFRDLKSFLTWLDQLLIRYNLQLSEMSGTVHIFNPQFKKHKRTKQGMGTSVKCEIKEYRGTYCYIPSDENCFYKCIQFIYGEKCPTPEEYAKWLFNSRTQRGKMTNCRIGKFNQFFKLDVGFLTNINDFHVCPRDQRNVKHKYLIINYFNSPDAYIGHYCVIDANHKTLGYTELKKKYTIVYKEPNCQNISRIKPFLINTENREKRGEGVYIFDFETFNKNDKDGISKAHPYSVGIIEYNFVKVVLDKNPDYLEKGTLVEDVDLKKLKRLCNIFISDQGCDYFKPNEKDNKLQNPSDCVRKMFQFIGTKPFQQILLIGHNAAKFDSYIPLFCNIISKNILKTSRGILSVSFTNPYASPATLRAINLGKKTGHKDDKQSITIHCSLQHIQGSLANFAKMMKVPENIRKTSMVHDMKESDYLNRKDEWYEYLQFDIISLTASIIKYNSVMEKLAGLSMFDALTSSSFTLKSWFKAYNNFDKQMKDFIISQDTPTNPHFDQLAEIVKKHIKYFQHNTTRDIFQKYLIESPKVKENILKEMKKELQIHSHTDPYIRVYLRDAVKGGRVFANINKFEGKEFSKILEIIRIYTKLDLDTEASELIETYMKLDFQDKLEIAEILKKEITRDDELMNFDGVSLYPSAMADKDSEFPKANSARMFKPEEEKEFLEQFNSQTFRPKTAILKVRYNNPQTLFLQHLPAKDKETFASKETKTVNRFRNGQIIDTISSVDIQEIVRFGGKIEKIYSGVVYEENYKVSPFYQYVTNLFELRLKYKSEKNEAASDLVKLLLNSLFGGMIRKDIGYTTHLWNENTLTEQYDETIKTYEQLTEDLYYVEKKKDVKEYYEEEKYNDPITGEKKEKKQTRLTPSQLGIFILSHSKRIMNNFIINIDGAKNPKIYYGDTDSLYIHKDNWNILNERGNVGNDLGQGKNDYGDGGIILGYFIAPKIKYCLVLNDKYILEEKKTFKGCNKGVASFEDFLKLFNGQKITKQSRAPWTRTLGGGISIPEKENEFNPKQYTPNINKYKRQIPTENGIMFPYNKIMYAHHEESEEFYNQFVFDDVFNSHEFEYDDLILDVQAD